MSSFVEKRFIFFLILFFIGSFELTCKVYPQTVEIASRWKNHPIVIDGKDDDWQDSKISVGPQKIVLSLANDESYLYLYVYCWDKSLCSKMLFSGFTVWFNKDDAKNKIGVHYPLGLKDQNGFRQKETAINMSGYTAIVVDKNANTQEQLLKQLNDTASKMEIIVADEPEPILHQMSFFKEYGIECMVGDSSGGLVYELKIPLVKSKSQIYGLGQSKVKSLKVSLDFFSKSDKWLGGDKASSRQTDGQEKSNRASLGGGMHHGGGRGHHGNMEAKSDNNEQSGYLVSQPYNEFPEEMKVTLADKK